MDDGGRGGDGWRPQPDARSRAKWRHVLWAKSSAPTRLAAAIVVTRSVTSICNHGDKFGSKFNACASRAKNAQLPDRQVLACTCRSAVCCFLVLTPSCDDQLLPPTSNGMAPAMGGFGSMMHNAANAQGPPQLQARVCICFVCQPAHQPTGTLAAQPAQRSSPSRQAGAGLLSSVC